MTNTQLAKRRHLPALILLSIAVAIVASGLAMRWSRAEQLREAAQTQNVRTVAVVSPAPIDAHGLTLPGRIEAWSQASIHARANGYLKRWTRDIGEPVKAGEVLAEIDTPDLDQQLHQARAELERARSEAALAETTAKRWQSLLPGESVSRQEVEERVADHAAKQSAVHAQRANVARIQKLREYQRLTAPFDGIVTARNTDVGALIDVGASAGSELFVVSDVRRLRVYVNVPQRQVALLQSGAKAQLTVPEHPGKTFEATVHSVAKAIDAGTGAMRAQLVVDNADGRLLPGGFATVNFDVSSETQALGLPPSALIVGRNGVQIARVDGEGRVQLEPVTIARDLGRMVELNDGLSAGDRVINSPPDGIASGDVVRIAAANQGAAK